MFYDKHRSQGCLDCFRITLERVIIIDEFTEMRADELRKSKKAIHLCLWTHITHYVAISFIGLQVIFPNYLQSSFHKMIY